ncbi:hypothetical protein JANAI62_28630 [Jannaschia pagri]|uniref:Type II toxin-antitoxin system VapC family toxin n=1 Tax=Jannaschia pagri TaxID=2829797 RepID=A0ABQ4NPN4_9RHOB|nr:hypothetical protein JANAI61_28630 [Jannaschia sp. AI_61]GIT96240.1 hypothetical protein JANAI62_28630 [Jannaschia sp. AI_62]
MRAGRLVTLDLAMAAYVVTAKEAVRDRDADALVIAKRLLRLL